MSEAVTMPSLMMTSIVSEESLVRELHTDRHRERDLGLIYLEVFQSRKNLKTKTEFMQLFHLVPSHIPVTILLNSFTTLAK